MDAAITARRDTMAESRTNNVIITRERISQYEVNAPAVAAAILERLLAGRLPAANEPKPQ